MTEYFIQAGATYGDYALWRRDKVWIGSGPEARNVDCGIKLVCKGNHDEIITIWRELSEYDSDS